jgi:hypothetical protein
MAQANHIPLKESFRWMPPIEVYTGDRKAPDGAPPGGKWYKGKAITVTRTGNKVKYTEEELKASGRSLRFRPVSIDHVTESKYGRWLPFPQNQLVDAEYEDGAVEYLAYITDQDFHRMYESGMFDHTSIEGSARGPEGVPPGVPKTPWGIGFTGMTFVTKGTRPGDPNTTVERLNETVRECLLSEIAEVPLGEPFGGYKDFNDCVAKNSDKKDPEGYCATIMRKIEGNGGGESTMSKQALKDQEYDESVLAEAELPVYEALVDAVGEADFDGLTVEEVKKWIQKAIKRPGAFAAKAKKAGMATLAYARKVIANKSKYDLRTLRQALLAVRLITGIGKRRHAKETVDDAGILEIAKTELKEVFTEAPEPADERVTSDGAIQAEITQEVHMPLGVSTLTGGPTEKRIPTVEERLATVQKRGIENDDKIRTDLKHIREMLEGADSDIHTEIKQLRDDFKKLDASYVKKADLAQLEASVDAKLGSGLGETKSALLELIQSLRTAVDEKDKAVEGLKETVANAEKKQKELLELTEQNEARRKEQAELLTQTTENLNNLRETLRDRKALQSVPFRGKPPDTDDTKLTETEKGKVEVEPWQMENFKRKLRK